MYIKNKRGRNKRGQSTVEYILLVTAVVTILIVFLTSQQQGGFQSTLNSTLNQASQDMNTMSGTLVDSHSPTNSTPSINIPTNLQVNL